MAAFLQNLLLPLCHSMGPMVIMLIGFVAIRQFYLYILTRYISNTPQLIGFGYPVGWIATCVIEILYFILRWKNEGAKKTKAA